MTDFGPPCPLGAVLVSIPAPYSVWSGMVARLEAAGAKCLRNPHRRPHLTRAELSQGIKAARGVIVGPDRIDAELIESAPDLVAIIRLGVGLDNIDLVAARRAGIRVTNTPGTNTDSVADLTLGLMISVARRMTEAAQRMRRGDDTRLPGVELRDKVLGVVGFGAIGRAITLRARGFGMEVTCAAHPSSDRFARDSGVETKSLGRILSESDVVTLHTPLTAGTRHLISHDELKAMQPSAYLINTSRAGIVDQTALAHALRAGELAGAGLDVLERGTASFDELLSLESVVATPHLGGATHESFSRAGEMSVRNLISVLKDSPARRVSTEGGNGNVR